MGLSKVKLGLYLRQERLRQKLTIDECAALCSLHRNSIQAIEKGKVNITLATLELLSRGLRVDVGDLLAAARGRKAA